VNCTDRPWYVYVIYSKSANKYYRGISVDPARRLRQHNAGKGAKYTRGRGPWELIAVYKATTQRFALHTEAIIKYMRKADFLQWCKENKWTEKNANHATSKERSFGKLPVGTRVKPARLMVKPRKTTISGVQSLTKP
jgi:putative endonuclease